MSTISHPICAAFLPKCCDLASFAEPLPGCSRTPTIFFPDQSVWSQVPTGTIYKMHPQTNEMAGTIYDHHWSSMYTRKHPKHIQHHPTTSKNIQKPPSPPFACSVWGIWACLRLRRLGWACARRKGAQVPTEPTYKMHPPTNTMRFPWPRQACLWRKNFVSSMSDHVKHSTSIIIHHHWSSTNIGIVIMII